MREVIDNLWIGNASNARNLPELLANGIETIVDLAVEEPPMSGTRELISCRFPIADGAGNSQERILLAVETVSRLVSLGISTAVCCSPGMSRSPAIAAAALTRLNGGTLNEALEYLASSGPVDVSPLLLAELAAALERS